MFLDLSEEQKLIQDTARDFAHSELEPLAAKLDRDDPKPLIVYYRSYVVSGESPTEMAATALETAYPYAGSDSSYRLLVTHSLLTENKLPLARQVLMPVAFRGHRTAEPKDADDPTLDRIMRLIDSGKRDEALAMTTKMIGDDTFDED